MARQEAELDVPVGPGRALMYALVSAQGLPNWVIRRGIPSWVPFVARDLGLTRAQSAMLLAAWFPGYMSSQIPAAALIDRVGPKLVLGLNTIGVCGLFMLLPLIARLGATPAARVRLMVGTLTVAGICQGPLIPGQQVMRRNWLPRPGSPERPIHMKLISLGGQFSGLLASSVTPLIAVRLGWRAVNYVMGAGGLVMATLWFLFAKSAPTNFRRRSERGDKVSRAQAVPSSTSAVQSTPKEKKRTSPLSIFRHPAVLSVLWCKMSSGNMNYTTTTWTPTYFMDVLGCTPLQTAAYLFWNTPIEVGGGFAVAATETWLLRRGVCQLKIRKGFQAACATGRATFLLLFGLTRQPLLAAIFINLQLACACLNGAGFSPNMIEVGGKYTATMNAVGNTMANSWGLLVPMLGAQSMARFGSYMPVFIQSIVLDAIGVVLFSNFARLTSPLEE
eukprot:SAG31_NODE_5158_length_2710_cov_1.918422_2_plen_447_part_00